MSMQNIIELKTLHIIEGKRVYCDVLTEYGMVTIPFEALKNKAGINEVINCTYENKQVILPKDIKIITHEYGIKLYHVSFDKLNAPNKIYNPRIPSSAAGLENKSIPRICLSDSIAGAITSIPDGTSMLSDDYIEDSTGCSNILYVGNITIGNRDTRLVDHTKIYNSNLVFDALSTHEYWWTSNCLLLTFRRYIVENMTETFHYIVSDDKKEVIAREFDETAQEIANKIRSLSGEQLYEYINMELTNNKHTMNKIGGIMFNLGIDDISVVDKLTGHYIKW